MKRIIVALVAAASLFAVAPVPTIAKDVAVICNDGVPDAWKRPGGFCDQTQNNNTLVSPGTTEPCTPTFTAMQESRKGARVHVAGAVVSCCEVGPVRYDFDPEGRVIVATGVICGCPTAGPAEDPRRDDALGRLLLVIC